MQSAPAFDLKFVASDQDVLLTLQTINKQHQNADVVVMNSHDGLEQDNLVHRLTIADDGRHQVHPGKLFKHSSPLVLVLDISKMRADEITAFNDLLDPDSPSIYSKQAQQKQPLGTHVKIIVLAHRDQLQRAGQACSNAPGADFWRRVDRPGNTWQPDDLATAQAGEAMDVDNGTSLAEFTESVHTAVPPLIVNCHRQHDWRRLLFGGPGVD
ncbi:hypothetical protein, partial [Sansalvadorimonas verongulae]|uniref:hypothetical protein n=1 Tax=Sansalvadorimonas verongulae TaxID=2172824 RepID=UPI0012BC10EB